MRLESKIDVYKRQGNGYMNDINWGLTAADQVYFPFIHVMDDDVVQYQYGGEMTGNFTRWQGFYRWEQSPFNDKGIPYKDETCLLYTSRCV